MFKFKKTTKNNREIPKKNYIILFVLIIGTILLGVYLHNIFIESDTNTPLMDDYISVINYNELSDYLLENKDIIIYSSYLGDTEIRAFEKEFRNVINRYELNEKILYLNLTNYSDEIKISLSNQYNLNGLTIVDAPCLVFFQNGTLVDIYHLKDNYDMDNLVIYLKGKEVIEND